MLGLFFKKKSSFASQVFIFFKQVYRFTVFFSPSEAADYDPKSRECASCLY